MLYIDRAEVGIDLEVKGSNLNTGTQRVHNNLENRYFFAFLALWKMQGNLQAK